jgi:hypothetical protein
MDARVPHCTGLVRSRTGALYTLSHVDPNTSSLRFRVRAFLTPCAPFLAVYRESKRSKQVTKSPCLALLAMAGSKHKPTPSGRTSWRDAR